MTNEIITTSIEIQNPQLRKYTGRILGAGANIRKSFLKIAALISEIDAKELYVDDGFKNVHEYTNAVLGIKKAQSSAMLRVGREYIDHNTYQSVLPHPDDNDYNATQLQALLPLQSVELAQELADKEIIHPSMSIKDIKEIVKEYKPQKPGKESAESENEDGTIHGTATVEEVYELKHTITIEQDKDGYMHAYIDGDAITPDELFKKLGEFRYR